MEYYHCQYCKGVWEESLNGKYIGQESDVTDLFTETVPSSRTCNDPQCQEQAEESRKRLEKHLRNRK